ncbi:hypothetical protein B0H14DRAFT_3081107 [Mycena olivaceomarginata]|nr:hypothetical protein B0H14DRAFT_3081107 [Mycena olivaceomarginata]
METKWGKLRGSYIWGRVSITLTEHLWYNVMHVFGFKWKKFFIDLEVNHGLNPTLTKHIRLLYHLFLHCINEDAQDQLQDGPCSIKHMAAPLDEVADPSTFGIDWDVMDDPTLMHHHLMQNPEEWANNLSEVPCKLRNSPFSAEQIAYLDLELAAVIDLTSHSMNVCKMVWKEAFRICNEFYE